MPENPTRVPISSVTSGGRARHTSGPFYNEPLALPSLPKSSALPHERNSLSALSASLRPPTRDTEAEPGHLFHLGRELSSSRVETDEHEAFGDTPRIPVPNRFFSALSDLSGCAVRLSVVLMREAYTWAGSGWKCSSRFLTRSEIADLGMSAQSVRNAAKELAERGWIDVQHRGQSHAYRWRLNAPQKRFTYLPLGLFYDAPASHSGLTALLAVYRATWGWTEKVDGRTVHKRRATLSTGDLSEMTGLCASTLRCALSKLSTIGALSRHRSAPGRAYSYRADPSFFRYQRTNSEGETSRERKSNQQTRAGVRNRSAAPSRDFVHSEGEREGSRKRARQLSEAGQRWVDWLMSPPFGMHYHTAARLVSSRSSEVLQQTRGMFEAQRAEIDNPGGWMRAALEEVWAGKIADKSPDVRQDSGGNPFVGAIDDMRRSGGENRGSQKSTGGGSKNLRGGRIGLSHSQMCRAIDALEQPPGDWETVGSENPSFVPSKRLANWAWTYRGELPTDPANEWAARLVRIRKRYEQTDGS